MCVCVYVCLGERRAVVLLDVYKTIAFSAGGFGGFGGGGDLQRRRWALVGRVETLASLQPAVINPPLGGIALLP